MIKGASSVPDVMLIGNRMVLAEDCGIGNPGRQLAIGFRAEGWAVHEVDLRAFFTTPRTTVGRLTARLMRSVRVARKTRIPSEPSKLSLTALLRLFRGVDIKRK
jgi:hypothetical protein